MNARYLMMAAAAGAAAVAMIYWTATNASAGDLGGSCCADLEERIAELEATTARKGNRKITVKIYGEVNKAVLWLSNDQAVIDNTTEESRIGVTGETRFAGSGRAGYVLELHSNYVSEEGYNLPDPTGDFSDVSVRRSAVWLGWESARLTIGRFDTATHELIDLTVANTSMAVRPLNTLGSKAQAGIADVVRGDVTIAPGFNVSASWAPSYESGQDLFSVAAGYAGNVGEFALTAGLGYDKLQNDGDLFSASASAMHTPSGVFLHGALVKPNSGDSAWHLTGGLEKKFGALGITTLFAEYGQWDGFCAFGVGFGGCPQDVWGLGIVQNLDGANRASEAVADVYASFRSYDSEDVVLTGARVRF